MTTPLEATVSDDITFAPSLTYRDPRAATEWLSTAFGFELTMAIEAATESGEPDPAQSHYEMASATGRGRIMIGGEWADWTRSPSRLDGFNTCRVHVALEAGLDEHCERARAAGARVIVEPREEFYGDRVYTCIDPEGHRWSFSMPVRTVTRAEAEAAIGAPIVSSDWA